MTSGVRSRVGREDGAIIVQVGAALLALTMASAIVIDYGAQLVSRAEVQNTVDAAALAAATSLAFDDSSDRTPTGAAAAAALAFAKQNPVWAQAPNEDTLDVQFPVCDARDEEVSDDAILACVQVAAYRNDTKGNSIPALIGGLLEPTTFGVSASAVAQAKDANATNCLKPLAIPDRWVERMPPWSPVSTFDQYDAMGNLLAPANRDIYIPPTQTFAGSGLTFSGFAGARVVLKPSDLTYPLKAWEYLPLQIDGGAFNANDVQANTSECSAARVTLAHPELATRLTLAAGGVAANEALIAQGALQLIAGDPAAEWNPATKRIDNSCVEAAAPCASMSPRVIALAVYDPFDLTTAIHDGVANDVLVRNIVGLFIASVDAGTSEITGYIVRHPGLRDETAITLNDDSSFLRTSRLVQ